jgi:hypothetical protein
VKDLADVQLFWSYMEMPGTVTCIGNCRIIARKCAAVVAASVACSSWIPFATAGPVVDVVWPGGEGAWTKTLSRLYRFNAQGASHDLFNVLLDAGNPLSSSAFIDIDVCFAGLNIDQSDALILQDGQTLTFRSRAQTIVLNNGLIHIGGYSRFTAIAIGEPGMLVLGGPGDVVLANEQNSQIIATVAGATLVNRDNSISGAGQIGLGTLGIVNFGLINANEANAVLQLQPDNAGVLNAGTLQASGSARLRINGVVTNTGGVIRAMDHSQVNLDGATIIGGVLQSGDLGTFRSTTAPTSLTNVVNSGRYELGLTRLILNGGFTNSGEVFVIAGDSLLPTYSEIVIPPGGGSPPAPPQNVTISGAGIIHLHNCKVYSGTYGLPSGRLTLGPQQTVRGDGIFGLNTISVTNRGVMIADQTNPIVIDPIDSQPVINEGTLRAIGAGGLSLTGGTFRNDGLIEVRDGSKCVFTATANLLNLADGALTGGVWRVTGLESPATLIISGSPVFFNAANVQLSGPLSTFSIINSMISNDGQFTIDKGRTFTTSGTLFSNTGTLTVGMGSKFTASNLFMQGPSGRMRVELGLDNRAAANVAVDVIGQAVLGGTLEVSIGTGLQLLPDQTLHVLRAASLAGAFASITAPPGLIVTYHGNEIIATATVQCLGDLDGDWEVNTDDLWVLLNSWGQCSAPPALCPADLDSNGQVDVADLMILIGNWGFCP